MDEILQKGRLKYAIAAFSRTLIGADFFVISFLIVLGQEGLTGFAIFLLILLLMSFFGLWAYVVKHPCICKIWQGDTSIRIEVYIDILLAFSVGMLFAGLQSIGQLSPEYRNFGVSVFIFFSLVHSFILGGRMNRRLSLFC